MKRFNLAAMHEKGLLREVQRQTVRQHLACWIHSRKAPLEIASYFTNEILFNWSAEVFEKQLIKLEDVLRSHSDEGSKGLAECLHAIQEGSRHGLTLIVIL